MRYPIAAAAVLLSNCAFLAFGADAHPNVLLILSDDHSLPHVGAYGSQNCQRFNITPNLDKLASEGMRFNRAYTAAPQCAPSRTAIFAGRSPVGISVTRFAQPARPGVPFFTDVLRKSGYWVGLDGRYQHLDGRARDLPVVTDTLRALGMQGPQFESRFDHFVRSARSKENLSKVGDMVGAALDEVPEGKPWFLYFGFNQPHRGWGEDHEGIDPAKLQLPADWPDLPEVRLDYARYLADVRDLDTGFGLIMELLEDRGIEDNTIVIFMGDNGEALLRGKGTLYTRGTNVPLVIRWPAKIKADSVSDVLVSGVDLAATILEAAGLDAADGMTGISFLPGLLGKPQKGRQHVFCERGWHPGPIDRTNGLDLSRSITSARYHFIYNAIPERIYGPVDMTKGNIAWEAVKSARAKGSLSGMHERMYFETPRPVFELYDLERDPLQLENLSGRESLATIEEELRTRLDEWMVRENDFLPLPTHVVQQMEK